MIDRATSNAYTCAGKRRYLKRTHAKAFAKRMRKLGGELLTAYRCDSCGLWHLGYTPKEWQNTAVPADNPQPGTAGQEGDADV